MRSLSVRDLRRALTHLDDVVGRAGEILITRHGQPIARVVPLHSRRELPTHADLRAAMPRLSRPSELLLREERDQR